MTVHYELEADEARLIQNLRAKQAIESRPVETKDALYPTMTSIAALVRLAHELEPKSECWPEVMAVLVKHGVS